MINKWCRAVVTIICSKSLFGSRVCSMRKTPNAHGYTAPFHRYTSILFILSVIVNDNNVTYSDSHTNTGPRRRNRDRERDNFSPIRCHLFKNTNMINKKNTTTIQINLNAALHIQQLFCFTLWRTVRICNHNNLKWKYNLQFFFDFFRCCCYCFRFIVFVDKNNGDGGDSDGGMSMVRWCHSVLCWCFLFGCQSCLWKCSPGCVFFLCGLTGRESNHMCATCTVQKAFESLIILRQFTVHNRDTTHIDRTIFTFIQRSRHSFFCLHWK